MFLFYFLRTSYGKKSARKYKYSPKRTSWIFMVKIIQIIKFLFYYFNFGYTAHMNKWHAWLSLGIDNETNSRNSKAKGTDSIRNTFRFRLNRLCYLRSTTTLFFIFLSLDNVEKKKKDRISLLPTDVTNNKLRTFVSPRSLRPRRRKNEEKRLATRFVSRSVAFYGALTSLVYSDCIVADKFQSSTVPVSTL